MSARPKKTPPAKAAQTKPAVSTLAQFETEAKRLGAFLSVYQGTKKEFTAFASPASGGCGSERCRCSPGLWVSASEGGVGRVAHFGEDFGHGGEGYFTRDDVKRWGELLDLLGIREGA